jgi:hypothetical protein
MYIIFRINNIFTGPDQLPTGPGPQKTAGPGPDFGTLREGEQVVG